MIDDLETLRLEGVAFFRACATGTVFSIPAPNAPKAIGTSAGFVDMPDSRALRPVSAPVWFHVNRLTNDQMPQDHDRFPANQKAA
jgi:hypothetical protein